MVSEERLAQFSKSILELLKSVSELDTSLEHVILDGMNIKCNDLKRLIS